MIQGKVCEYSFSGTIISFCSLEVPLERGNHKTHCHIRISRNFETVIYLKLQCNKTANRDT